MNQVVPGHLLPVILSALLLPPASASPLTAQQPVPSAAPACSPTADPEPLRLAALWEAARDREPGYIAASEGIAAEEAFASSVRREWAPVLAAEGVGNYGQRLSPSEERALGVGSRGELRLSGIFTVLDSDRLRRGDLAVRRGREAAAAGGAFDAGYRAMVAAVYAEAAASEELRSLRWEHLERLRELAAPVRAQTQAGVDVRWEAHLVEEALARGERLLAEAERDRVQARVDLSHMTGRCVRALAVSPSLETDHLQGSAEDSPAVQHLRRQADTQEAVANQEASLGAWQLQLVGSAGPNHSRALENGPVRNEYLVGITGSWRPDLAGVRRQLAASEAARARAARAEAESLELALGLELERIRVELEHGNTRQDGLRRELEQARLREEAAFLRWQEGVDRWTEVMQARDRVLELSVLEIELTLQVALALVRHAEATGSLEGLPTRLGQENER